jgi:hypothetical protein
MGGTPRSPKKPRPSYEDGALRDPEIAAEMDPNYGGGDLTALIERAVKVAKKPTIGLGS